MKESDAMITSFDLFSIGSLQLTIRTMAQWRALIVSLDGILLGKTENGFPANYVIGQPFDLEQIQGLEAPFNAALSDETDPSLLYTIYEPNERYVLAIPVSKMTGGGENRVVGVFVVFIDNVPNQTDVPANILNIAGRSLLIFLLGIGIMGTIFGAFFARGLSARFKQLSTAIDAWSEVISQSSLRTPLEMRFHNLAQRLNNMAKRLAGVVPEAPRRPHDGRDASGRK